MPVGNIAIMTDDPGWHGARLRAAFHQYGYASNYISLTDCLLVVEPEQLPVCVPGFEDKFPDGVFVRGVPGGSLDEVILYLDVLHALQHLGVMVYNDGRAIERSVDKAMTSFLLRQAGIPTPATWIVRCPMQAKEIAERELRAGHGVVTKPLFGSQGEGLQRLQSIEDLPQLTSSNGVYYMQRFVESSDQSSHDWRVFVIRGKAVAAMRRYGSGWLNNVAQGARCEVAAVSGHLSSLGEAAVNALNMSYGGVDIICNRQGEYSVLEVNSIPAWKGLQSVCGLNIGELLAEDFLAHCRESVSPARVVSY